MRTPTLSIPGFSYEDLHKPERLAVLASHFYETVRSADPALMERFDEYRKKKGLGMRDVDVSAVLVDMAPHVSRFVAGLFGVENECKEIALKATREQVVFLFKKEFVVRRVIKKFSEGTVAALQETQLNDQIEALLKSFSWVPRDDLELQVAAVVTELLEHERFLKGALPPSSLAYLGTLARSLAVRPSLQEFLPSDAGEPALKQMLAQIMGLLEQWVALHYYRRSPVTEGWVSFKLPRPLDYHHLVDVRTANGPVPDVNIGPPEEYRRRDGFDLTDPRFRSREVMSEIDYCIFCHERSKDSCSKGMKEGNAFKKNPLGYTLKGCPLDQKISESHALKANGDSLGALALIMIDNPMVPGTGHRICNDCMKACIFQKQDPVNIPQVETGILTDVLDLPWGFEIYSLLTRWNPLNVRRPHALPYNGMNILVVGLGPAGYTLAHYFLNEGFGVVGIDGLKIEPLARELTGDETTRFMPIRDFSAIRSRLSERVLSGFGGVSEYGITVRWDKNFLTVLYLNLARRDRFRIYDGIRFGGTITVEDAWKYGFHHVCLAAGAGKPTFVSMKNNLIRGIRKASDFLMALQLTGAAKKNSMGNLQIQLPAVVIGGGLTAIDAATELMAYYPVQVEKIRERYDALCDRYGKEEVDGMFDEEERERLRVFLAHANDVMCERARAARAGVKPDFIPMLRAWGGVHIYYRKSMLDSPAYRLNHEEIIKSLEEGISFVEKMSPLEAVPDTDGVVKEMIFERMELSGGRWKGSGEHYRVPARTVMVAAGTVPNTMYEREHPGTFALDEWDEFFEDHVVDQRNGAAPAPAPEGTVGFFTSYEQNGRMVSFYGDNHPDFAGNVVRAMASAKQGYQEVLALLADELDQMRRRPHSDLDGAWKNLVRQLDDELRPAVVSVQRLTPAIVEVIVRAPRAAWQFRPGQFYRLQNYEVDSFRSGEALLMMEGVALTGAWVDKEKGLISLIALEVGASSRMCSLLKPGQRVVVMGPTGTPTEIGEGETALLLGGGLGNAVLFSIAKAFKEKGGRVIYFAGYKKQEDLFKREDIEASTDVVVYSVDAGEPIRANRPQDRTFVGNIVEAALAYARGELGSVPVPLDQATRIIAIGSDRMMAAVAQARHGALEPYLNKHHVGIASINSPMQCMMKAICAQCLQRHVDPVTGKESFVFSCVNQDQPMDQVDFANLHARLRANTVMEKLTNKWLDYVEEKFGIESAFSLPGPA
jgi:NADPH-dependent glutamate synthase beta subunit-like oxidoreductase/NAD(P)H-flavin reductase